MSNYRISCNVINLVMNLQIVCFTTHLAFVPVTDSDLTFYFFPIRIIPQTLPVFLRSPLLCASLVIFVLLSPWTFFDWNSMPFVTFNRNYLTGIFIYKIFNPLLQPYILTIFLPYPIISSPSPNRRTFLRVSLKSTFGSSYPNSLNAS